MILLRIWTECAPENAKINTREHVDRRMSRKFNSIHPGILSNLISLLNPEGRSSQVAERRVDLDLGGEQGARRPRDDAHRQVRVERDGIPARSRLLRPGPRGVRRTGGAPGGREGDAHCHWPRRQTRQLWCVPTVDLLLPFCEHNGHSVSNLITQKTENLYATISFFVWNLVQLLIGIPQHQFKTFRSIWPVVWEVWPACNVWD